MQPPEGRWRQTARVFHERADEYDSWYENSLLFGIELAALESIVSRLPRPRLELGVGPGRFAAALGISLGIDPALAPLVKAGQRGVAGIAAIGEQLPVRDSSLGTIFLLFTFCFLNDPESVLRECSRVLRQNGRLVVGLVPARSPWGALLRKKGRTGNPYYRHARFHTVAELLEMATKTGFVLVESRSTLFQPPNRLRAPEPPVAGHDEQAGFCVLVLNARR